MTGRRASRTGRTENRVIAGSLLLALIVAVTGGLVSQPGTGLGPRAAADPDRPAVAEEYLPALSTPVDDPYYPYGSTSYDVLHYGLDLSWAPTTKTLTGVATIDFRIMRNTNRVQFDLSPQLVLGSATIDGEPAVVTRAGTQLQVAGLFAPGENHSVTINYSGRPEPVPAPTSRENQPRLGFQVDQRNQVSTVQEPFGAFTWYPVNDHPSDKALYDITIRAANGMVGVTNGQLASYQKNGDNTVTTFHLDHPAPSYLTGLTVGYYNRAEVTGREGLPITYWTPVQAPDAASRLEVLPTLLTWAESKLGPYPFSSLGAVVVDAQTATETQGLLAVGDREVEHLNQALTHELVRQWYGALVTPQDWTDVWMNEGMALLLELSYEAETSTLDTPPTLDQLLAARTAALAPDGESDLRSRLGPPGNYRSQEFGDNNVSVTPAIMWNQLRHAVGDDRFWELVRLWPQQHAYGNADRQQLYDFWEEQTGLDLSDYFNEWITGFGSPQP